MLESPPDLDAASHDDLKKLILELLERLAAVEGENAALREEVARLKGLKGRPRIKPSGMAEKAKASKEKKPTKRRRRGAKRARLRIDEERVLSPAVPPGSRFKGYEDYIVQDLVVRPRTVRYQRERWRTPAGETVVAPLPAGTVGHFGPELRRFVVMQYYRGQVTVARILTQLEDVGVAISKRQVMRILSEDKAPVLAEARGLLRAGLETAPWVSVDDTGARHKARNAVCTQIGDARFAWFATTGSKSRKNFLELLRAGHGDYVVNEAALAYMRARNLAGPIVAELAAGPRHFPDATSWQRHLAALGLDGLKITPEPVRIATEGALWGAVTEHGLLQRTVIVSDDAGQFNVGGHALCWVHAERLVHKLDTFTDHQRAAVAQVRARIWWLYADLKGYCRDPAPARKAELKRRFERLFRTRTGFASLDRLLRRLLANKAELLMALERPEIPLHTNGSENDLRCQVTKRKISGGTRSDLGRDCRDAFLSIMKTCDKLGLSFWDYLGARLQAPEADDIPPLPELVRTAAPAH